MRSKAFTLIELLVVMAITAILLTLIGIPLIQGLNLTRATQAFSEAQDAVRSVVGQVGKEMSTAAAVLDNSVPEAAVEVALPLRNAAGNVATINVGGQPRSGRLRLHNAKIDIVPPAKGDPSNPNFNPGRNRIDPTLKTSIGQVILPVAPGQTLIRYWIGLRRPINDNANNDREYSNPWMANMTGADRGDENLYVLYRAEVQPYIYNSQLGRYVVNTAFFAVDPSTGAAVINDPGFFLFTPSVAFDNLNAHRQRLANWMSVARIMVQESRTDLIMPEVDESTNRIIYDAYSDPVNGNTNLFIPRVRSMATFQPMRVSNEPATGNEVSRIGDEGTDLSVKIAPEFFKTGLGGWTSDSFIRVYRQNPNQTPPPPYFLARWEGAGANLRNVLVYYDPSTNTNEATDGLLAFDVTGYLATLAAGAPRIAPNLGAGPNNGTQLLLFTVDQKRGRLQMRFPIVAAWGGLPRATTATANGKLTGWLGSPTRAQYNPSGDLGRRFVDLRQTADFAIPPAAPNFNPFELNAVINGWSLGTARIMPGSEIIFGPDQRPGPNFGAPIRYTRIGPSEEVGLNEYKINYTDQREPNWTAYGVPDPSTNADVRTYIQPRFKVGYLEFHSDPTLPMPAGNIDVLLDFQLNAPGDSVVVDYDTNQQIRVELTLRRYSGGFTVSPQTVTMTDVVAIRNFVK